MTKMKQTKKEKKDLPPGQLSWESTGLPSGMSARPTTKVFKNR